MKVILYLWATTTRGTVLQSRSIGKVENHWPRTWSYIFQKDYSLCFDLCKAQFGLVR